MRPRDWSPLASTDPFPGDALEIARAAAHFSRLADEIERQAAALVALVESDELESEAVDRLRTSARELGADLGRVPGRYRAVGAALREWAPAVEAAQVEGDAALLRARRAQQTLDSLSARHFPSVSATVPGLVPTPEQQVQARRDDARRDEALDEIARAAGMLHSARDRREVAERRMVRLVRDACRRDHLRDSRWDSVKAGVTGAMGAVRAALRQLSPVMAKIAKWAGVVSSILGVLVFVLVLFAPGAIAIIGMIALTAACLALVMHSAMLVAGTGSKSDVGKDALGVVLALFGAGALKGATAVLKGQVALAEGEAAGAAVRTAAAARVSAAKRTLGRAGAGPAARTRAQAILDSVDNDAAAAERAAAAAVKGADLPPLTSADAGRLLGAGGDPDVVRAGRFADAARHAHPSDLSVVRAAKGVRDAGRRVAISNGIGLGLDGKDRLDEVRGLVRKWLVPAAPPAGAPR